MLLFFIINNTVVTWGYHTLLSRFHSIYPTVDNPNNPGKPPRGGVNNTKVKWLLGLLPVNGGEMHYGFSILVLYLIDFIRGEERLLNTNHPNNPVNPSSTYWYVFIFIGTYLCLRTFHKLSNNPNNPGNNPNNLLIKSSAELTQASISGNTPAALNNPNNLTLSSLPVGWLDNNVNKGVYLTTELLSFLSYNMITLRIPWGTPVGSGFGLGLPVYITGSGGNNGPIGVSPAHSQLLHVCVLYIYILSLSLSLSLSHTHTHILSYSNNPNNPIYI